MWALWSLMSIKCKCWGQPNEAVNRKESLELDVRVRVSFIMVKIEPDHSENQRL